MRPERLPKAARLVLDDPTSALVFSAVSIWETAIKSGLDRPEFRVDVPRLHGRLLENGYKELPVLSHHGMTVQGLPRLHGDPFDRLLLAQAMVEGLTLLTTDHQIARYPGPIQRV